MRQTTESVAARAAVALRLAGGTRVGPWIAPAHRSLTYRANFDRLRLVAGVLSDPGLRLGLACLGPRTAWTSARHSFIHSMAEMKELSAATGRPCVGLVLDSWPWYTAGEGEAELCRSPIVMSWRAT